MTVAVTQPRTRQRVASLKIDDVMYGRIQRLAEARRRTPYWGMYATLGEVAVWMRCWGTDEELPMPCHSR